MIALYFTLCLPLPYTSHTVPYWNETKRTGKGHTLTWLHSQGIFPLDAFVRVSSIVYCLCVCCVLCCILMCERCVVRVVCCALSYTVYCFGLYCTVLYCTVLYCIVPYCTVLFTAIRTTSHSTTPYHACCTVLTLPYLHYLSYSTIHTCLGGS